MNKIIWIAFTCVMFSCVERYDFDNRDQDNGIVIQSYISNKSFLETAHYPSDGRIFKTIISRTSDVSNTHDKYEQFALVSIEDNTGREWIYRESQDESGHYYLNDAYFKAEYGYEYRLNVILRSGNIIHSEWQKLPERSTELGNITFTEDEVQRYGYNNKERFIDTFDGVNVLINLPKNKNEKPSYYRWDFEPLWVFEAPYLSIGNPIHKCWVTSEYYLSGFELEKQQTSESYKKKLFFIDTHKNEKIYEYFSVLITQQVLNPDYYNFWKELKKQGQNEGLFDEPPFSLKSNYYSNKPNIPVSGYFGVVTENASRWVFNKDELSYYVENDLKEECDLNICIGGPCPPPSCSNCLDYIGGNPINQAPWWWDE